MTIDVTVSTAGAGTLVASIEGREIVRSRTPFFVAARTLFEDGTPPKTILTMRWSKSDITSMRLTVGAAARLTVSEDKGGTRITPWRSSSSDRMPQEGLFQPHQRLSALAA